MDRGERRAFRAYLGAIVHGSGGDKQLALLDLVESKPAIKQHKASEILYGDPRSKGFIMMKGRLYDRLVDFLCMVGKSLSDGRHQETPYTRDMIACRRHMLTAALLADRNLGKIMMDHLKKALELARSCQNPELEVDILLRMRGNYQLAGVDFDHLSQQVQGALDRTSRVAHATGVHHAFFNRHTLQESATGEMVDYLDQHVPDLELRLQQEYSARADYYLQILQVNRHKLKNDFPAARAAALKAIDLLETFPGIRSRARSSDPHFQLGIISLKEHQYKDAVDALTEARSYLKPHSQSFFAASTLLAMALVHAGFLEEAEQECEALDALRQYPGFPKGHSMLGLHTYLKACVAFLNGSHKAALDLVRSIDDLTADKAGWGTGLRIFELMILVEMEEPELAESRLEPLRKHLERHPGTVREKLIYKLFRGQGYNFFSFDDFQGEEDLLEAFAEGDSWDPAGKEVIRVDSWYLERKKNAK